MSVATKSPKVGRAFSSLDSQLQLDPGEYALAHATRHRVVNPLLESGCFADSFIQGSFGRKTMLSPLHDVDVVVLVSPAYRTDPRFTDARSAIGEVVRLLNNVFTGCVDLEKAAAKAVQVKLPNLKFTVDVVTARETTEDGIVEIANRESGRWERSATRRLASMVRARNVDTDGQFVHRVRMLKAAKDCSTALLRDGNQPNVSGILMESLAFEVLESLSTPQEDIAAVLAHAALRVAGSVSDPTHEDDLTRRWNAEDHVVFAAEFARLARIAERALELEATGFANAALSEWHAIFGPLVPAVDSMSESQAATAWTAAGLTTSGAIAPNAAAATTLLKPARAYRP